MPTLQHILVLEWKLNSIIYRCHKLTKISISFSKHLYKWPLKWKAKPCAAYKINNARYNIKMETLTLAAAERWPTASGWLDAACGMRYVVWGIWHVTTSRPQPSMYKHWPTLLRHVVARPVFVICYFYCTHDNNAVGCQQSCCMRHTAWDPSLASSAIVSSGPRQLFPLWMVRLRFCPIHYLRVSSANLFRQQTSAGQRIRTVARPLKKSESRYETPLECCSAAQLFFFFSSANWQLPTADCSSAAKC